MSVSGRFTVGEERRIAETLRKPACRPVPLIWSCQISGSKGRQGVDPQVS